MKQQGNFYNNISIILIALLVIGLIACIYFNHSRITVKDQIIENMKEEKARLDSLLNVYMFDYDNIQIEYANKLDSLSKAKTKITISYENRIKDLRDITIVSDDSVTQYISSRIQDRK